MLLIYRNHFSQLFRKLFRHRHLQRDPLRKCSLFSDNVIVLIQHRSRRLQINFNVSQPSDKAKPIDINGIHFVFLL